MIDVYDEVLEERARQDEKWGGAKHDDEHDAADWFEFIENKIIDADSAINDAEYRLRMIQIAALAVAAVESLDRHTAGRAVA